MLIKNGNEKGIKEYTKDGNVIVSVYAQFCGTCEMMAPILEEISKGDIKVVKFDVDYNQNFVTEKRIGGTPAHFFYKDGEEISRLDGFQPKEVMERMFDNEKCNNAMS